MFQLMKDAVTYSSEWAFANFYAQLWTDLF